MDEVLSYDFKLHQYFDRLWIPTFEKGEKSKDLWTAVIYSSIVEPTDMRTVFRHWCHNFRKRDLQCEKTLVVGWGLYSTRNMDGNHLVQFFKNKYNLDLSCWWRLITQPSGKDLPEADCAQALHFEVSSKHYTRAKRILYSTYHTEF